MITPRNPWQLLAALALLVSVGSSCAIKSFSVGKNFHPLLHQDVATLRRADLKPADRNSLDQTLEENRLPLATYHQFKAGTSRDTLLKFQMGCYLLRLENKEDTVNVRRRKNKPPKNFIRTTVSQASDSLLPPFSDKLSYLVFLDDHRVMYHSPYRKNYLKTGTYGKVTTNRATHRDTPGYARSTENFIKLGTRFEFNSFRRGYYKRRDDQLLVCLELNTTRKECPYPTTLLLMKFRTLEDAATRHVASLIFTQAWYENDSIDITETFSAFERPDSVARPKSTSPPAKSYIQTILTKEAPLNSEEVKAAKKDSSTLHFTFLKTPFTLLLVETPAQQLRRQNQNEPPPQKTNYHLVDRIETLPDGRRRYECKQRHQFQGSPQKAEPIFEPLDSIITF